MTPGAKIKIKRIIAVVALWSVMTPTFAPSANALFKAFDIFSSESLVPEVARTKLISILVEDDLLLDTKLENKIRQYAVNAQTKIGGKSVLIPIPDEASPLDIYEGNAHLYFSGLNSDRLSQLVGTVLIGNVPLPVVEKNGNLWPTIFPYTDFEKPTYEWNRDKKRFVFVGGDHEPEVWHGVIRSDRGEGTGLDKDELFEMKKKELIEYFDRNSAVHDGTETFAEKIFYADLPRQAEGLDTVMREKYDNFIAHVEDIAYMRFSNSWAAELLDNSSMDDETPWNFFPDGVRPAEPPKASEGVSNVPDIHTKSLIEGYASRYFEAWKNYLSRLNERIDDAGRWDAETIDTTISLISQKDEVSALTLKQFNDRMEARLNLDLASKNIAENISVFKNTDHPLYTGVQPDSVQPLYTNGVNRDNLTVGNCSLIRGSPTTVAYPRAQMVEANRAYNFATKGSNAAGYAGCYADSLRVSPGALNFSAPSCVPANATLPIFDIKGSHKVTTGVRGAQGCENILIEADVAGNPDDDYNEYSNIAERFDSLMIHNEPTSATIMSQMQAMGTQNLPIDDPRGFSFYDHGKNFQRLNYINLFDFIGRHSGLDDETRKTLLAEEIQDKLATKIAEINAVTTAGNAVSNAQFDSDFEPSWPNQEPVTPPTGYGGICTYDPTRTEWDSLTDRLEWLENCDWWEGGVIDNPAVPDQTSGPNLARVYETTEGNIYNEAALIAHRQVEWPGNAFALPPGYVGGAPACTYTLQETILDTNLAKLLWTANCPWTGIIPGDPLADPPVPDQPGSGTLTGRIVRFYETNTDFPAQSSVWPGVGYDPNNCTYQNAVTTIDGVTTSKEWTETCPGPVVETITHIFENATVTTTQVTDWNGWPGTPFGVPAGGTCGYSTELHRNLSTLDTFTKKVQWTESCQWNGGANTNTAVMARHYETGDLIPTNIFDGILGESFLGSVTEAIIWIDKDLALKNRLVLNNAFSPLATARKFFINSVFGDGYELVEIIGEKANSLRPDSAGIKMSFERGEDASDSQYWDAKREASLFAFDTAEDGKTKNEGMFSGVFQNKKEKAKCDVNVLKWFPCFMDWLQGLPEYFNQKISVKVGPLEMGLGGTPLVFPSEEKKSAPEKITSLRIIPAEIRVTTNEINPISIEVSLLNKNGQVIQSDFSSEVELVFSDTSAEKFLRVAPSNKIPAVGGKALFSLLPQQADTGGKFFLTMKTGGIESERVPVTVTQLGILASSDGDTVTAGNKEGITINATIQDTDFQLSHEKDGGVLLFSSDWGTFEGGGRARIKDGNTKLVFSPGVRAGKATIKIQDEGNSLPPVEIELDIVPDSPAVLALLSDQKFLVSGAGYVPVEAELRDQFGNALKDKEHTVTWYPENLEIKGTERGKSLSEKVKRIASVSVRPMVGVLTAKIYAVSDAIPIKVEAAEFQTRQLQAPTILREERMIPQGAVMREFRVPKRVMLHVDTSSSVKIKAGSEEIKIPVKAETSWGERINGDFEVKVLASPAGIGEFPKSLQLEDGLGEFVVSPGTRTGNIEFTLTSQGFDPVSFAVDIVPDDPEKILLSLDRDSIDTEEDEKVEADISVVDRFGNLATQFTDKVYLSQNEPEAFLESDDDLMQKLGVIPDPADRRNVFLEQEAAEARAKTVAAEDLLLDIEDGGTIQITDGKGKALIQDRDIEGKVFLTAKAPGLIPDAVKMEVTDYFSLSDAEALSPKSLVTLLLGFEGGDLVANRNMGNRFLFSGRTQAVGTLIAEKNPAARFGTLGSDGTLSGELQTVFQTGEYLIPEILFGGRRIATIHVLFPVISEEPKNRKSMTTPPHVLLPVTPGEREAQYKEPEPKPVDFFITEKKGESSGIYFVPAGAHMPELKSGNRKVSFQGEPVFSVSERGGISLLSGGSTIIPLEDNSILHWNISVGEETIGEIFIVLPNRTVSEEKDVERLAKITDGGIFIVRESADLLLEKAFTGSTTLDPKGIAFVSSMEKADKDSILGAPAVSVEEAGEDDEVIWQGDWKPAALFAAGNTIGESTMWGSSDAFILLGDPTVTVGSENTKSSLEITPDIGDQVWKSPDGQIDQVLIADLNGDDAPDILPRVGNTLFALYQDDTQSDNFRDTGQILRFADDVRDLVSVDNNQDKFSDFVQLNGAGGLVLHRNTNGVFTREKFEIEGVSGRIASLKSGNIDDDEYKNDLIFSDEGKNLFVAFGTENPGVFSPLYKIDSFAPYFKKVDENFVVADEQDTARKYLEPEKYSQLNEFYISYDDIEETIDDTTPENRIRTIGNPDIPKASDISEKEKENRDGKGTPPPSGGGGGGQGSDENGDKEIEGLRYQNEFLQIIVGGVKTSFSALGKMVDEMKDAISGIGEDILGKQLKSLSKKILTQNDSSSSSATARNDTFQLTFLSAPFNTQVNTELKVSQSTETKMAVGDEMNISLSFTSNKDLENFQFMAPSLSGLTVLPETFSCTEGCEEAVTLRENSSPESEFWTQMFDLSAEKKVTFAWSAVVKSFPPLSFMVFDFEGNDGIDDIAIPTVTDDGKKQFIEYISAPPNRDVAMKETSIASSWKKLTAAVISGYEEKDARFKHSRRDRIASNPVTPESPTLSSDVLSTDSDADGLPDMYDTFGSINWADLTCGGCGLPIPSLSFLGPGKQALYVPPYSLSIPSLFTMPVFWITTVFPFVYAGAPMGRTSLFRLFIMPTITAQVGLGICLGTPMDKAKPLWFPNCFVFVVPVLSALGLCPDDGSSSPGTISKEDLQKMAVQNAAQEKAGSFSDVAADWRKRLGLEEKFKLKIKNKQIKPADIITTWFGDQKKELEMFKLPTISVIFPKLPKAVPFVGGKDVDFEKKFRIFGREGSVSVKTKEEDSLETREGGKEEIKQVGLSDWAWAKDLEKALRARWTALDEYPFINIRQKDYPIPVPVIPAEQWNKYSKTWEERWKPRYDALRGTTWKSFREKVRAHWDDITQADERAAYKIEFEANCSDTFYTDKCAETLKKIEFLSDFVNSFQKNIKAWEQNENNYKTNKIRIRDYFKLPEDFKIFGDSIINFQKEVEKAVTTVQEYLSGWKNDFDSRVTQWKKLKDVFTDYGTAWEDLKKLFKNFFEKCPVCAVNRGSSIEWLSRIFLGGIKLPVIPVPKLPDIRFDFSDIDISISGDGPVIIAEPIELALPEIPDIDFSFNFPLALSVGKLAPLPIMPVIPVLPKFPQFNFQLPIALSLPKLPNLIGPPYIPNLLEPVIGIIKTLKKLTKLLCYVVGAFAPVPEWYVAGYVQELTNRTKLFKLDFSLPAMSPVLPSLMEFDDTQVLLHARLGLPTGVLELLNQAVGIIQNLAQCTVDTMSQIAKGDSSPRPCSGGGVSLLPEKNRVLAQAPKIPVETLTYDLNDSEGVRLNSDDRKYLQKMEYTKDRLFAELSKDSLPLSPEEKQNLSSRIASAFSLPRVFATILSPIQRWLVSTNIIDVSDIPVDLPEGLSQEEIEKNQEQYSQYTPAMYYYDADTGSVGAVTEFPVTSSSTYVFGNIRGDDDTDEMVYALGRELFLKYRIAPTRSNAEQDDLEDRYEDHYGEDYNDRFDELIDWSYDSFREKYAPAKNLFSRTEGNGSSLEFERISDDISYYEWRIFNRPDYIFETGARGKDRITPKVDRVGFLLRPPAKKYEIRLLGTRISKIKGSPILYASPLENIERIKVADCTNPDVPKPFFPTESLLIAEEPSRMEIRVPPRAGQTEEFREITMKAGEETMVDYAEVCLTRGSVQKISTKEVQRVEPTENLYLPQGARIELGPNDAMEIVIFDGTKVVLNENEHYTVRYFDPEKEKIDFFRYLPLGNFYGEFVAATPKGESFAISKFLHDPQVEDDMSAPTISIKGGAVINVPVFQKVSLDATASLDDQNIAKVWWDLNLQKDSDKDGDSENDQDFPLKEDAEKYFPRNLLKVALPPYEETGTFFVKLNVADLAGNTTSKKVEIRVSVPDISLYEASSRSASLEGRIKDGTQNIPISFERNRNGQWELILTEDALTSTASGVFRRENLRTSGGIEIIGPSGEAVIEILETGRPVVINPLFDFVMLKADEKNPLRIELRNEQKQVIASLFFEKNSEEEVILDSDNLKFSEGMHVVDIDSKDSFEFINFEKGLAIVDTTTSQTVGLFDKRGDFRSETLNLGIKPAEDQKTQLVFEILDESGKAKGEFFMGFQYSGVKMEKNTTFLKNVSSGRTLSR